MADDQNLQDQVFDLVKRSQELMVDASRNFVEGAADLAPGDREALDRLIDNAFDLTERLLEAQREFAKKVVATATSPLQRGGADTDAD